MDEERRQSEALPFDTAFPSVTVKRRTGCGSLFVTVGWYAGKVNLVFARLGKGGGCANVWCHSVGELIAEAVRANVPVDSVVQILKGVVCSSRTHNSPSCLDAIGNVLEEYKTPGWKPKKEEGDGKGAVPPDVRGDGDPQTPG